MVALTGVEVDGEMEHIKKFELLWSWAVPSRIRGILPPGPLRCTGNRLSSRLVRPARRGWQAGNLLSDLSKICHKQNVRMLPYLVIFVKLFCTYIPRESR